MISGSGRMSLPYTTRHLILILLLFLVLFQKICTINFLCILFIHVRNTKFLFTAILGGYPTFVTSILFIGLNTAVIGDVAGHLGCFINLKDSVNAIAFVALGTSVPGKTHARPLTNACASRNLFLRSMGLKKL